MLRRNPSKIELKLEDVQELENKLKLDAETKKNIDILGNTDSNTSGLDLQGQKTRKEIIEDRIGFNPRPRNSK